MTEPRIIFDVLEQSGGLGITLFSILWCVGIPIWILYLVVRRFRKVTRVEKIAFVFGGLVAVCFLILAVVSLFMNSTEDEYRKLIQNNEFSVVEGEIYQLTESTILKGKPVATFTVDSHIFSYGRGSENYGLQMAGKGGFLANGLSVRIWFKDDIILRVFALEKEGSSEGG